MTFYRCALTFILFIIINVYCAFTATLSFAQYAGGSDSGSAETTIGSDIFTGGSQSGSGSATTGSAGSLSHGDATHISK
ncbi:MAG: hypothetical protein HQL16_06260 [Candidatus Omnitrophica bacterium]|nr:hypothetical protein [Candidatus Omnitrophota bacterium]